MWFLTLNDNCYVLTGSQNETILSQKVLHDMLSTSPFRGHKCPFLSFVHDCKHIFFPLLGEFWAWLQHLVFQGRPEKIEHVPSSIFNLIFVTIFFLPCAIMFAERSWTLGVLPVLRQPCWKYTSYFILGRYGKLEFPLIGGNIACPISQDIINRENTWKRHT